MNPQEDAVRILALLHERAPRLGAHHLLCIDGPAGSGKTTLAAAVLDAHPDAVVLHLDDLLDGWSGLPTVVDTLVRDVLVPLAAGENASFRRYDWVAGRFAEHVAVPPASLLVVEGVGAGSRSTRPFRTASVWLDAPSDLRRSRAVARDGEGLALHWDAWARAEVALFATEKPDLAADLTITAFH